MFGSQRDLSRNSDLNDRDNGGGEQRIEILSYLDKKGGKSGKKRGGMDMDSKALEEFENDFNALDADEIIKKYIDIDKPLKREDSDVNYDLRDLRGGEYDDDEPRRGFSSVENKDITHDDLQGFIEQQKSKVSSTHSRLNR